MKILYLAAGHGVLDTPHEVIYQDLLVKRDIGGDMLNVDLTGYDLVIATPPCNYYSRANRCFLTSSYSQATKHLLPSIIKKLEKLQIPVIVENVINKKRMASFLNDNSLFYIEFGRHCYFVNRLVDFSTIEQQFDFSYGGKFLSHKEKFNGRSFGRQGGINVKRVLEHYIETCL